jgi:hypothetical protein
LLNYQALIFLLKSKEDGFYFAQAVMPEVARGWMGTITNRKNVHDATV